MTRLGKWRMKCGVAVEILGRDGSWYVDEVGCNGRDEAVVASSRC